MSSNTTQMHLSVPTDTDRQLRELAQWREQTLSMTVSQCVSYFHEVARKEQEQNNMRHIPTKAGQTVTDALNEAKTDGIYPKHATLGPKAGGSFNHYPPPVGVFIYGTISVRKGEGWYVIASREAELASR